MSERPIRDCAECGQSDDHPRHVVGLINAPTKTRKPVPRHLDCCAAAGCTSCSTRVATFGGRTGQDLIDHLAAQRAARTPED